MPGREASRSSTAPRGRLKTRIWWTLAAVGVLGTCLLVRHYWDSAQASAQAPASQSQQQAPQASQSGASAQPPASSPQQQRLQVMAVVNNQKITRQQLADACIARYGAEVLESLVNKHLIAQHCRRNSISVTEEDVRAEIERLAKKFRLGTDQYLQLLQRERGVTPDQYARDIVWPTLALRRLAQDRLTVSPEELQQAKESTYGEAVMARMIALKDIQTAQQVHTQLKTNPNDFARLAREHSIDAPSASVGGRLAPIRRHMGDPKIEQVVFGLQPGELSQIVRVADQFAIFMCERRIPAQQVAMAEVEQHLRDKIIDRKLREAAGEIFQQLQESSVVENIYNDPAKSRQMPGVAATINGQPVTMRELAEECLMRHGETVLEGEINYTLVVQELAKNNLQVTQAELDAEIANAALLAGVVDENDQPDVQKWIKMVTEEQGVDYNVYVRDAVWPSAALKKLVEDGVQVTDEDVRKGIEANYGPRVRCRAIVISNLRRAQEVWNKARQNQTAEYFGKLAQEYSEDAASAGLGGEVPPIRKHGGRPRLEKEAFALQPGGLSGVIQVGDRFVILFCEGFTEPVKVEAVEVRDLIYKDVFEKKLRLAMAERFDAIRNSATIDNYLTGDTQAPKSAPQRPQVFRGPAGAIRPKSSVENVRR